MPSTIQPAIVVCCKIHNYALDRLQRKFENYSHYVKVTPVDTFDCKNATFNIDVVLHDEHDVLFSALDTKITTTMLWCELMEQTIRNAVDEFIESIDVK